MNRTSPPPPAGHDVAPLRADAPLARRPPPGAAPVRQWRWIVAGAVLALLALVLGVRLLVIDRLWPETRGQTLLDQAALALAEGRLDAEDGSGARQLYEAAAALDPDDVRPRAGLSRVSEAALQQARAALEAHRFDPAPCNSRVTSPRRAMRSMPSPMRYVHARPRTPGSTGCSPRPRPPRRTARWTALQVRRFLCTGGS